MVYMSVGQKREIDRCRIETERFVAAIGLAASTLKKAAFNEYFCLFDLKEKLGACNRLSAAKEV